MKEKIALLYGVFFFSIVYAQEEPVKIEGYAQGTTYHITYFEKDNRNYQPEIEKEPQDRDHDGIPDRYDHHDNRWDRHDPYRDHGDWDRGERHYRR